MTFDGLHSDIYDLRKSLISLRFITWGLLVITSYQTSFFRRLDLSVLAEVYAHRVFSDNDYTSMRSSSMMNKACRCIVRVLHESIMLRGSGVAQLVHCRCSGRDGD